MYMYITFLEFPSSCLATPCSVFLCGFPSLLRENLKASVISLFVYMVSGHLFADICSPTFVRQHLFAKHLFPKHLFAKHLFAERYIKQFIEFIN